MVAITVSSSFLWALGAVSKSCLNRQITEGVIIHNSDTNKRLNGKIKANGIELNSLKNQGKEAESVDPNKSGALFVFTVIPAKLPTPSRQKYFKIKSIHHKQT